MKHAMSLIVISLIITFSSESCEKSDLNKNSRVFTTTPIPDKQLTLPNDYSLELSKNTLVFKKDGKHIFEESIGSGYTVNIFLAKPSFIEPAESLCLILEYYKPDQTFEYHVFKVSDGVKLTEIISNGYERWHLYDTDNNEIKVIGNDWYNQWGAKSVAPKVILKWNGNKFVFDKNMMKQSQPISEDLISLQAVIRKQLKEIPFGANPIELAPPELACAVYDLYYSGKAHLARKFYDRCWPPASRRGKEIYWSFLMKLMVQSNYWPDIKAINGLN